MPRKARSLSHPLKAVLESMPDDTRVRIPSSRMPNRPRHAIGHPDQRTALIAWSTHGPTVREGMLRKKPLELVARLGAQPIDHQAQSAPGGRIQVTDRIDD